MGVEELSWWVTIILGGPPIIALLYNYILKPSWENIKMLSRLMSAITDINTKLDKIDDRLMLAEQTTWALHNDLERGLFRTDAVGNCLKVNRTYSEMTGLDSADVLGNGWLNAVHKEDRKYVKDEWDFAVEQGREFNMIYRIQQPEGPVTTVRCVAKPLLNNKGKVDGYIGSIKSKEQ